MTTNTSHPSLDVDLPTDSVASPWIFSLAAVGAVWYIILWALSILGCQTGRRRYRNRPRSPLASAASFSVPGVSVLRPLKGLDTNLYENLESTFTQEYPSFEVLLSVADERDQALPIVRELMSKYPHVDAKIIVGEEHVGENPKVNNLIRPYRQAKNDILWVIDSNIMSTPGTMARAVDALQGHDRAGRKIGVVHHIPFAYAPESRIGSRIDEAFLNTNHAKMYLAINAVAIDSCVVGKSNMYRRSDVERVNGSRKPLEQQGSVDTPRGLQAFGKYMAEDNMLASAIWHELGMRHDLSCDVARNVVGKMTFMDYVHRRVRWIRVRKHMVLLATVLEPFTECILVSAIGAWAFHWLFNFSIPIFLLLHYALWIYVDLDVYNSLAGHPLPESLRWEFMLGWAAREILTLPIFFYAVFGNEVQWRGTRYEMLWNGEVKLANQGSTAKRWWHWIRQPPKGYEAVNGSAPP
ncbi:glycosyltransferase family 21 protein [Cylindrobasidium torrendii FP15055 ss-10]|uniref:Ceramide glucosyltransferase n=1 Tax=Cylindrobasidium torrendii FP15055 ss-10 TaxID=1314674 RepID=A0A0D7BCT1_9AGAR|nr:glycosyltransferase family 21 protein [Cylindrobasidium torrendii FP15055 ss-10]